MAKKLDCCDKFATQESFNNLKNGSQDCNFNNPKPTASLGVQELQLPSLTVDQAPKILRA